MSQVSPRVGPIYRAIYGAQLPTHSPKAEGTPGRYDGLADAWARGSMNSVDRIMARAEAGVEVEGPPPGPVTVSFMPCPDCGKPHHRKRPCPDAHALAA